MDRSKIIIYVLIFIASVFVSSVSQILLKKSANKDYGSKIKDYLNVTVISAYSLFLLSTLITTFAYKGIPFSMGPMLESLGYIFVSVMGWIFLKEKMTVRKTVGMCLILIGIAVFSLTGIVQG